MSAAIPPSTDVRPMDDHLGEFAPFLVNVATVWLMTFGAYFDESERLEETDPMCVAGFVFRRKRYEFFCRKWKRLLATARPGGIRAMHMTDLIQGKKGFEGLSIPRRQQVFSEACLYLKEHAFGVIGAYLDQDEFEMVAGPDWPERFGSTYTFLCQRAAQNTGFWLEQQMKEAHPVVYTFESGHKFEHEIDMLFNRIAREPMLSERFRYGQHVFALKEASYGAQAADIMAWSFVRARIHEFESECFF